MPNNISRIFSLLKILLQLIIYATYNPTLQVIVPLLMFQTTSSVKDSMIFITSLHQLFVLPTHWKLVDMLGFQPQKNKVFSCVRWKSIHEVTLHLLFILNLM